MASPSSSSPFLNTRFPSSKSKDITSKLPLEENKVSAFSHPAPQHFKSITSSTYNKTNHKQKTTPPNQSKYPNGLEFIRHKKLLSELSTWGIGGPCNYFIQVTTHSQLISALRFCHDHSIRFLIVGKGSNCLFDDSGYDGCVILNQVEFIERIQPGIYRVGSGYPFNRLGMQCCNEGFSGLEFAGGIPGTVGGAVYMNAGADGQETDEVIDSVEVVTLGGRHEILNRKDVSFSYRRSSFQDMKDFAAITAVTFRLTASASARERQRAYLARRKSTQPVGERSAGSVFQNPPGLSAGELIEKAGLKGYKLGGAKISEIHANFFINSGSSTSRDMLELIQLAKEKIDSMFGIQLMEEVRYINACNGNNSNIEEIDCQ